MFVTIQEIRASGAQLLLSTGEAMWVRAQYLLSSCQWLPTQRVLVGKGTNRFRLRIYNVERREEIEATLQ